MTTPLETRLKRVEATRRLLLEELHGISEGKASFKPRKDAWCVQEITEHLALAEEVGVLFIWRATISPWEGEHPHRGLTIEEVVAKTWREREVTPEPAAPRFGGPLAYWCARLEGCARQLDRLANVLEGKDLERIIYPHVLSGPLDAGQRIDFLAFHMERHLEQMRKLREHVDFPKD